jgi:predicted SprT family Zn-dependent metalloprotease
MLCVRLAASLESVAKWNSAGQSAAHLTFGEGMRVAFRRAQGTFRIDRVLKFQRPRPQLAELVMDGTQTLSPSNARQLALNLMRAHGLRGWEFAFNRAKRTMGLCRHAEQRIELSVYFVLSNEAAAVRDCILHEIAHALAGSEAGHGPKWRRICHRIGAKPERCGEARMPDGKWWAICPKCQREYTRHRRPGRNLMYCCSDCGWDSGQLKFRAHSHESSR